jgi:glucose-1-phosphate thymidylyltransferase
VGYKKERIMDHFGNGNNFGVKISYIDQDAQLGTAHAIKCAEALVGEKFIVLNGDNLIDEETILDLLRGESGDISILSVSREHITGYGVLLLDKQKVSQIIEKPRDIISHLVNTGIYIFSSVIFNEIDKTPISEIGEYAITETIQKMIEKGAIVTNITTRRTWIDAVYSWDLLKANSILLGKIEERKGSGPNITILPSTAIGDNCSISSFTEIENSIIMNDTRVGAGSFISNSIIGSNNIIDSHFVTEVRKDLNIEMKGILHHADLLGSVTGDNNIIGHLVLVHAGKMISNGCSIDSGAKIVKNIPQNSIVM